MLYPDKKRLAYLTAITLLFSYIELMLPRPAPFIKLGLSNIPLLLALELNFSSFILLTVLKALIGSFVSGTLFSPFLLISLAQSLASGIFMYGLFRISFKWIGICGISILASALSAFVQISLSSLYLKEGAFTLLGPMLFFSAFSGLVTGLLSLLLKIYPGSPELIYPEELTEKAGSTIHNQKKEKIFNIFTVCAIFVSSAVIFYIKNIPLLAASMFFSFVIQLLFGRKIKILPHITLWLFVFISGLFTPGGKVLFSAGNFAVTQGALTEAFIKSMKLSAAMALSQTASCLYLNPEKLPGMTIEYFSALQYHYSQQKDKFIKGIQNTLNASVLTINPKKIKEKKLNLSVFMILFYSAILVVNILIDILNN